ncbi:DUF4277 domain-containing protein [Methanophagales archaeon]|nr:MAG: DUF4277 domain-containing protein [Methanophagales archaeon]
MSRSIPYMVAANLLSPLDYAEYTSKSMDHLGIVATVCKEICLADEINRIVGVDPRQKVTCGEAVVVMILNALGFVDRPLYLFPEFMATKPVEILIREGLKPEDFNPSLINISTGFVAMNSGNRYSGRSTNPKAFKIIATTASPQVTFWRGSTPTILLISSARPISLHTVATMPRWSRLLLV